LAGDGQVSFGETIIKRTARKIRRLHNGQVLAGFAGSTADALALFGKFEAKLEEHRGQLERAAVELSKEWRTDRILRRLEAFLIVMDRESTFLLSGAGDIIAPDDGLIAVGSGGPYALAAARALSLHSSLDASNLALEAMKIAAGICVYTNDTIVVETL
jgi:ATP-dependent HslUV protease subunit HslV